MSENSDGGGGSQISALDDLLAGGVAGSASVIVGRELDLFTSTASVNNYRSNILLDLSFLCGILPY